MLHPAGLWYLLLLSYPEFLRLPQAPRLQEDAQLRPQCSLEAARLSSSNSAPDLVPAGSSGVLGTFQ